MSSESSEEDQYLLDDKVKASGVIPTLPDAITPLPKKQVGVLAIVVFGEPLNLVFLFPFVFFMVRLSNL
jgi:hypothetical protein